jgi:hypothetical protein
MAALVGLPSFGATQRLQCTLTQFSHSGDISGPMPVKAQVQKSKALVGSDDGIGLNIGTIFATANILSDGRLLLSVHDSTAEKSSIPAAIGVAPSEAPSLMVAYQDLPKDMDFNLECSRR